MSEIPITIRLAVNRQHIAEWLANKASAELSIETAARFRELGIPDERMEANAKAQLQRALAALKFLEERRAELEQERGPAEAETQARAE